MPSKKTSGGAKGVLRSVVGSGAATDTLLDLVERLGLADLVIGQVRSRIEQTDMDELMDDVTDYLRRNPEVLVATLGAVTIATGLLVWINSRREWDGGERRRTGAASSSSSSSSRSTGTSSSASRGSSAGPRPVSSSSGRVRRPSSSRSSEE